VRYRPIVSGQCNTLPLHRSVQFVKNDILRGSVATFLGRGRKFNDSFVANFLPSLSVKNVENRLQFGKDMMIRPKASYRFLRARASIALAIARICVR